jgi:hypothetical protein
MKLICTFVAAAAVGLTAVVSASPAAPPKIFGTVGPGFTISLKQNGKPVKTLKAGLYTFVISDKSSIHSFVVEGPGVERDITSVPFVGTKTVTFRLHTGKYKFYCRAHESSMFGYFRA